MVVPTAPPPGPLADLARFLAVPPPPPAEIHVTNALRRDPITAGRVAGAVVDEVAWKVLGGGDEGGDDPPPRITRVQWMRGGDELARIELKIGQSHAIREALLAARRLRIPVHNRYENNKLFGTDTVASYFAQRPLPAPGPLAQRGGLEDTPEHLDLMVGHINRPGRIGRTVLRRDDEHHFFRARLDGEGLAVETGHRNGDAQFRVDLDRLLGVVVSHGGGRANSWWAATIDGVERIPKLSGFADAAGEYELEKWLWARVNQRLGL